MAMSAEEEGKQSKQAEQEGDHRAGIFSGSAQPDQSLGAGRSFGEGQVSSRWRTRLSDALPAVTHENERRPEDRVSVAKRHPARRRIDEPAVVDHRVDRLL